ncbi:MAG: tetratricopeptide repeat protein [Myxococcales bacterium]|nr:tetratricopeptide repeat protein [Myxococcales bacterium]
MFSKLNMVPPAQVDAALHYAKGKAYYAKKDYANAAQSLQSVGNGNTYTHQARYFLALVAMRTATTPAAGADGRVPPKSYKAAIDAFRQVIELPSDTDDHRHIVDLAWMAIGRLFYEMESYQQATEAYSKVTRGSAEFDTMLYELAWVYVRLGDVQRAERALELLQVSDPGSTLVGDGTLLRADLLLRSGSFDKSLELYQGVRDRYEPMRAKVDAFLDSTRDPRKFYHRLADQQLEVLDQADELPPLALRWAREAEDGASAFRVIDDVTQCKTLIRQSYVLIDKLTAILGAANRVRAFPEIAAGEEQALALLNRMAQARLRAREGARRRGAFHADGGDRRGPRAAPSPHAARRLAPGERRRIRGTRLRWPAPVEPGLAGAHPAWCRGRVPAGHRERSPPRPQGRRAARRDARSPDREALRERARGQRARSQASARGNRRAPQADRDGETAGGARRRALPGRRASSRAVPQPPGSRGRLGVARTGGPRGGHARDQHHTGPRAGPRR